MYLGNSPEEIEVRRKLLLMRFFVITGNLIMLPLLIVAVLHQRWQIAAILFAMVSLTVGLVWHAHRNQQARLASQLLSLGLWLFASYLMVTGGFEGTGIYFAFALVVLMIMVAGLRLGTFLGLCYLILMVIVLVSPTSFTADYTPATEIRLLLASTFLVLLCLIAEWIHLQSYAAIKFTVETHRRNSLTDPLTTLVNRAGLERSLSQWTDPRQQAAVALIDIDHFKQINDQYGHATGDQALAAVAKVLRNNLKQDDIVSRWGGEEFVLLFTHLDLETATAVVEKLRLLLDSRTFNLDGQEIALRFSAGVATFTGQAGFDDALKQADERVYQAKRAGRNRVVNGTEESL